MSALQGGAAALLLRCAGTTGPVQRRPVGIHGGRGVNVPINLSSEPFRKDRPLFVASVTCSVLLTALLGVMVFLIASDRHRMKDTRSDVERLSAQVRRLTTEQAGIDTKLRQPVNAEVLYRSLLLHTLIERKSISWTKIFA